MTKTMGTTADETRRGEFWVFQVQYLFVYLLTMFADWLQGTHMYVLYESYSLKDSVGSVGEYHPSRWGKTAIATLFTTGFLCSGLFGTFVGSLVDRYGRKNGVVLFCVLEIAINTMEEYEDMRVLLLGRVLGGISTSLLFSAFESWMVTEHRKRDFPDEWLSHTFAYGQIGNGIVAIIAGLTADVAVNFQGNIGPFRCAVLISAIVLGYVSLVWTENAGDVGKNALANFPLAWNAIWKDYRIMLVGFTNAFFEGAMYTFVFNWFPAMSVVYPGEKMHAGTIFSTFMACITLGGYLFNIASSTGLSNGWITLYLLCISSLSLIVPAIFPHNFWCVYGGFLLFETCVGASFATGGALRSAVMPQELQATIMNIFRVPLNILVVIGTSLDTFASTRQKLFVCVHWLVFAVILQAVFVASIEKAKISAPAKKIVTPFLKRIAKRSMVRVSRSNTPKRSNKKVENK